MSDEIGEIFEEYGEKSFEWRIPDFMSELEGAKVWCYESPKFFFADCCWCFKIHPNGNTEEKTKDWIELYIQRMDQGVPKNFRLSLSIILANGEQRFLGKGDVLYSNKWTRWGWPKVLRTSELPNREADIIQSGILTFICTLKSQSQESTEGSLFKRLWNLSLSMKNILDERKGTDVVLKLEDGEIPAHRIILESRSSVFNRMFGVDMREAETGEVSIEDGYEDTFKVVLSYAYSGNPEGLCAENVCEVYEIAHIYDLEDLRKLCVDFMQKCLTVDTICDVIILADVFHEMKLKECAKNFFTKNVIDVFKTEEWNEIKREDPGTGCKVLECVFGESS